MMMTQTEIKKRNLELSGKLISLVSQRDSISSLIELVRDQLVLLESLSRLSYELEAAKRRNNPSQTEW